MKDVILRNLTQKGLALGIMRATPGLLAAFAKVDRLETDLDDAQCDFARAVPGLSDTGRTYLVMTHNSWGQDRDVYTAARNAHINVDSKVLIYDAPEGAHCEPINGSILWDGEQAEPKLIAVMDSLQTPDECDE